MSDLLQSGIHPDADRLSAFVERALPAHEQQETLAHLAVCEHCRTIVALSLPAFEEATVPEPVADRRAWYQTGFLSDLRGRFSGWAIAWPAAALAALLLLTLQLRTHTAHLQGNTAQRHDDSPRHAAVVPPAPVITAQNVAAAPAPRHPRKPAQNSADEGSRIITSQDLRKLSLEGREVTELLKVLPGSAINNGSAATAGKEKNYDPGTVGFAGAAGSYSMSGSPADGTPVRSDGANLADPGTGGGSLQTIDAESTAEVRISPPPLNAAPPPAAVTQAASSASAARTVSVAAAAPMAVPSARRPASDGLQVFDAASVAPLSPLPSGLPVLSVAANAHLRLAIDAHNALFASSDDGAHWRAVPAPWQGHAVRVAVAVPEVAQAQSFSYVLRSAAAPALRSAAAPALRSAAAPAGDASATGSLTGATTGRVAGTVTDVSGAVIPGAIVTLSAAHSALVRTARTDSSGSYGFTGLAPGSYRVEAVARGFTVQSLAVELAPSQPAAANLKLAPASAEQAVTVNSAQLQSAPAAHGSVNGIAGLATNRSGTLARSRTLAQAPKAGLSSRSPPTPASAGRARMARAGTAFNSLLSSGAGIQDTSRDK